MIILTTIILVLVVGIFYFSYVDETYVTLDKPILYLYPETEMNIEIKFKTPEKLTCTYPKYEDSWNVLAKPDGSLIDTKTNRSLYALYWEGKNNKKNKYEEGFVIKGEDTITFLEEKLKILGLNEREANEFIIYWLPKLEGNPYNYIRFATQEEINQEMPLDIFPKPDTLIRVWMQYKELPKPILIKEQKIETPERKGYVVIEWGGTKIEK